MTRLPNDLNKWLPSLPNYRIRGASDVSEGVLNKGMISSIYPTNIPEGAVSVAKNVRVRYDRTMTRTKLVYVIYTSDGSAATALFSYKDFNGAYKVLKFTKSGRIYFASGNVWVLVATGAGSPYNGRLYFSIAIYNNTVVFAGDGKSTIGKINTNFSSISDLNNQVYIGTNSYRYITVFFNRLVAAHRSGNPIELAWSADGNIDQWNNAVDETAGLSSLVESPGDYNDFITGIFGFSNVMIVLREKSLWEVVKLPSGSNPFNAYCKYAHIGSDCPRGTAIIPNGLIFVDTQTKSIYMYELGGVPKVISEAVINEMFDQVIDVESVYAVYDGAEKEYHVYINGKFWIYNLLTQAWSYDMQYENYPKQISAMTYINKVSNNVTYDSLAVTYDSQNYSYDSLDTDNVGGMFYGDDNGNLLVEDNEITETEVDVTQREFHTCEVVSKSYEMQDDDIIVNSLAFVITPKSNTSIELQISKNEREWITIKEFTLSAGERQLIRARPSIRARSFRWRLLSSLGYWELHKYTIKVYPASMSKE